MQEVILLNYDYSFLNKVTIEQAMRYIAKGKVTIEKFSEKVIKTATDEILSPLVLRLVYLVRSIYKRSVEWSKRNVMVRDNYTCVYCGIKKGEKTKDGRKVVLNIDHVHPQSKGGKNTFENTVTSCTDCNNRKGDLSLREANMFFKKRSFMPYAPTIAEFIKKFHENLGVYKLLKELGIY